jgi:hypothetical protein
MNTWMPGRAINSAGRSRVIGIKWKEILMSPTKKTTKKAEGFSDFEKAAMKERARELKAAANKADGESAVLEKIAEMPAL